MTARADNGLLTASTQTKNESAPEVVQLFLAEFDRLGREPLDTATVAKRKTFLAGRFSRSAETSLGLGLTQAEARQALFGYIERYYNRHRMHSAIGYLTPEQAEQRMIG